MRNVEIYRDMNNRECTYAYSQPFNLAPLPMEEAMPCTPPMPAVNACKKVPVKGPKNMDHYINTDVNLNASDADTSKRDFLRADLTNIRYKHLLSLRKQFYLDATITMTLPQLSEALAAKQYIIKGLDKDTTRTIDTYDLYRYLEFRDPTKPADQKGFDDAVKALHEAEKQALRIVMVKDPATDGLNAVTAFEGWTYTAPTA